MTDELKQQHSADAELRKLIEDAAKLTFGEVTNVGTNDKPIYITPAGRFNPLDPERGDLRKVAEAAKMVISYYDGWVRYVTVHKFGQEHFLVGDYQSLALAVLRAASMVWKARNGNAD